MDPTFNLLVQHRSVQNAPVLKNARERELWHARQHLNVKADDSPSTDSSLPPRTPR
jgi:hypothetical protein